MTQLEEAKVKPNRNTKERAVLKQRNDIYEKKNERNLSSYTASYRCNSIPNSRIDIDVQKTKKHTLRRKAKRPEERT